MTETKAAPRDLFWFPRPADIDMFFRWTERPELFAPGHPLRGECITALRMLVTRLDLHRDFEQIILRLVGSSRASRKGDLFGQPPPPEMTRELYRVLRFHGYVQDTGERTPLSGMQLYILRNAAHGITMTETAEQYNCDARRFRAVAVRMYRQHGCSNLSQMIGCAYRNGWLPTWVEMRELIASSTYVMAPGFVPKNGA